MYDFKLSFFEGVQFRNTISQFWEIVCVDGDICGRICELFTVQYCSVFSTNIYSDSSFSYTKIRICYVLHLRVISENLYKT